MKIRRAVPADAEACWSIRNLSIREGCQSSYEPRVLAAWTPESMPENYRKVIAENPFFVVEMQDGRLAASGYLDLSSGSVEAIFTLPEFFGRGLASMIIAAIKSEAVKHHFSELTLSSTPNAQAFYEKQGFMVVKESVYPSGLARADLRCIDMSITL